MSTSRIHGSSKNVLTSLRCQEICSKLKPKKNGIRQGCDRNNPCAACVAGNIECRPGTFMVSLKFAKRPIQRTILHVGNSKHTIRTSYPLYSAAVIQNADGNWGQQPTKKRKADEASLTVERLRLRRKIAANLILQDAVPTSEFRASSAGECPPALRIDTGTETPSMLQSQKCKTLDDYAVTPSLEAVGSEQKESNSLTSAMVVAKKRKSGGSRQGGYFSYYQSVQDEKAMPLGEPPVWADKRQSLCETLPYYRAYQSGAYMNQLTVRGFMCDKEVGPRDKFTEEIMIARV